MLKNCHHLHYCEPFQIKITESDSLKLNNLKSYLFIKQNYVYFHIKGYLRKSFYETFTLCFRNQR